MKVFPQPFTGAPLAMLGTLMLAAAALAGCQPAAPPPPPAAPAPTVFETMNGTFTPLADKLWELAGELYNDAGEPDATMLTDQQWQELARVATTVQEVAHSLAAAQPVRVAPAGVKIQNEDVPEALGAAEVQALIDADPQDFREESLKLAAVAADFIAAARNRDAILTDDASNRLNDTCTECHARFWYPEQATP